MPGSGGVQSLNETNKEYTRKAVLAAAEKYGVAEVITWLATDARNTQRRNVSDDQLTQVELYFAASFRQLSRKLTEAAVLAAEIAAAKERLKTGSPSQQLAQALEALSKDYVPRRLKKECRTAVALYRQKLQTVNRQEEFDAIYNAVKKLCYDAIPGYEFDFIYGPDSETN